MSHFKVVKGKDGRRDEVIIREDVSEQIYDILSSSNLLSCEKLIVLPIIDLIDRLGLPVSQVNDIVDIASQKLCPPIIKILQYELDNSCYSFGSRNLDDKLRSVLVPGSILEIWGESGSGKTQLALQMCAALHPTYNSVYISTVGSVPTGRLMELGKARDTEIVNCDIQSCYTVDHFSECIMKQLPLILTMKPVKLIVIDSIAAPFRAGEVDGGGIRRAQKIRSIGQQLKYLASKFSVLVVVINQATDNPLLGKQPALGLTWSYLINSRLQIDKPVIMSDNETRVRRVVRVDKAVCLKPGFYVECMLHSAGLI